MKPYAEKLGWTEAPGPQGGMSFKQGVAAVLLPMAIQVACLFLLAAVDPCNNNPGCMAGSLTGYALVLLLPASLIFLIFLTLIEEAFKSIRFKVVLIVNSALAFLPFLGVFVLLAVHR
jgi:hypothetical protein